MSPVASAKTSSTSDVHGSITSSSTCSNWTSRPPGSGESRARC
eukprot:CAMPEP_0198424882 /NCGR_PEP_ID=MMETSP1452-20131203/4185_1 /TAXON_ID=1181717 /ORGANISM="Synchroma pusillum, Strain CCMP3072" /LENGTH=42 /DNA_ID= /DNA_START= /DNA_END= /DNA_ORIENTATION=